MPPLPDIAPDLYHSLLLRRKAHSPQEQTKSGVVSQRVEDRVHLKVDYLNVEFVVRSVEPFKRFVLVAQTRVNQNKPEWRNIFVGGSLFQLLKRLSCFGVPARNRVGVSCRRQYQRMSL